MTTRRGLGVLLYLVILCTLASGLVLYCVGRLVLFWICWCHLHGVEGWKCCWWWSGSCGLEGEGGSLWWQCWWWRGRQQLLVKKLDVLARGAIGLELRSLLSWLLWSPRDPSHSLVSTPPFSPLSPVLNVVFARCGRFSKIVVWLLDNPLVWWLARWQWPLFTR